MEAKGSSGASARKTGRTKSKGAGASHRQKKLGRTPTAHKAQGRPAVATKLAISFEGPLADDVRRAAKLQTDGNVSAWLAEAARDRLRQIGARALLDEYESEHGPISEEIMDEVRRQWPR